MGNRKAAIILFGITSLGLLLRLWGAGHGLGDELFTHPDERPFAYEVGDFYNGYFHKPFWQFFPLWTYLYTIGVYLFSFLEGILKYPLGMRTFFIEPLDVFRILLIGRVSAGIIGAMTIPIVYLIGKRLFNEKTGMLSAGIMAVLYLHVTQSHYAYVDVPQAFFLALSFYYMVRVSTTMTKDDRGEKSIYNSSHTTRHSFLAGIFLALAIATKINAAPGIITLIIAHYHNPPSPPFRKGGLGGLLRGIKEMIRSKYLYISISGLIIGYGLCTPWSWIKPMSFIWAIRDLLSLLYGKYGQPFDIFGGIKNLSAISLNTIGLPFIILFSFILIIIFMKKDWKAFFVLSLPLAYLPFFLLAAWQDQRELLPVIPFLVVFTAYGIYRAAEIIPYKRKGAVMLFLSLLFILPSLWSSLKADYFSWQKDTRVLAAEWIRENLPWNVRIGMEGHIYYNTPIYYERYEINGEFSKIPVEEVNKHIDFIVISNIIYDSLGPEKKKYYDSLKEKAQLIKVFDTFPSYFFNPRIEVYKLSLQGEAITSIIPKTYSEKDSYFMSFNEGAYGKEPLSFWMWPDTKIKRVLVSEKKLKTIGIFIYNGSEKTDIKVKSAFDRKRMTLNSYERKAILLNPSRSFPFIKYIYTMSISCGEKGGAFVSILTDPKRIGNGLLESGDWEQAIQVLTQKGSIDREEWSLLGLAYSLGGKHGEALEAFRKGFSPSVRELLDGNEWKKTFEKFANIDSAFLRDSLTINYSIDQFQQNTGRKRGWVAQFDPRFDKPGTLLFGPYKRLPAGAFKAVFNIRTIGHREGLSAKIDVFNGEVVLAEKAIKDTGGRFEEISLNFYNEEPDSPLEFRVEALGGKELWAEDIKVFPDIQGHYKRFLGMINHHWGLSAGELGLSKEAIEHFRIADVLGYRDTNSLYRMASVYEKINMKEEAMRAYKEAISNAPDHIDSLIALKRIQGVESEGNIKLEEKIKALTPEHEKRQNFGDMIEFIGYNIRKGSKPPSPQSSPLRGEGGEGDVLKVYPGDEFRISYFWRALKKIRTNYFIFVHIQREGAIVFQNDHSPPVPMKRWREGGVTREDFTVRVPSDAPAGNYDIVIGVWNPEGSRESIKLKGRTIDKIKIGTIEVSDKPQREVE